MQQKLSNKNKQKSPEVTSMSHQEMESLIKRVEESIEHGISLDAEDLKLLLTCIRTLILMQGQLENNKVTLNKLRKLLGIVASSEKLNSALLQGEGQDSEEGEDDELTADEIILAELKKEQKRLAAKARKRRKSKKVKPAPPQVEHHKFDSLSKGSKCPCCKSGTLINHPPGELLRVTGNSLFSSTRHITEKLRCNNCLKIQTAKLPEEVLADGEPDQKYGYSARAVIGVTKYGSGTPFNRIESIQQLLGQAIPSSTQFDQVECMVDDIKPVSDKIKEEAANGYLFYIDDTHQRILSEKGEYKENRTSGKQVFRTGVKTSVLVSYSKTRSPVVLFKSSLGHAGEFTDEILSLRNKSLPKPVVMSDALSQNRVTQVSVDVAYCNVHARRMFCDCLNNFPEEARWFAEQYNKIFTFGCKADANTKFSSQDKLEFYSKNSLPIMEEMKSRAEKLISSEFEEHSAFGKALKYYLRHYHELTAFCRILDAPIDNNIAEQELKNKILIRKNSYFYKTQAGADVADAMISIISNCALASTNAFDYLTKLQQLGRKTLRESVTKFLPWAFGD